MPPLRHLPRLLLNAATVVSLLLCVVAIVLGARGYSRWDRFRYDSEYRTSTIHSRGGQLAFQTTRRLTTYPSASWAAHGFAAEILPASGGALTDRPSGFYASSDNVHGADWQGTSTFACAPAWFVALVLAVPPAVTATARVAVRRAKRRRGHCPACGYDLRATPERCPECGTIPP